MGGDAVVLSDVWKRFRNVVALRGISFRVRRSEIFGLVGPNGAGKTTTLRIISTLVKHDNGFVEVLGHHLPEGKSEVRRRISYLPEDAGLYHRLTGWENLLYFAMIYTEDVQEARKVAEFGATLTGLSRRDLGRRASEYSKGMARRVAIARTLMVKPDLVILDEPTSGLDVFSAYAIRGIIKNFVKKEGMTAIISSHNMLEVQSLCDRVALINRGKIVAIGTPKELIARMKASDLEEAFIRMVGDSYE
ncbi:MAG: multidrug ABC transporter ATP-binding protein [Thermoprotei archaeon]|nr:MAG: multidrug ABC transporter ATP-binding protein [Thermoprotei archaeon]